MDTGLTTIHEDDIAKHLATAQSLVTRMVVMEDGDRRSSTALAGTGRRFVSTVSTGAARRTREVELTKTIQAIGQGDQLGIAIGGNSVDLPLVGTAAVILKVRACMGMP